VEVQRATASTEDAFVQYFGALFAGAELEALGRREQARQSYERAAAQCPTAQAPLVALSELARHFGDRRAALAALDRLAALPADPDERIDPWWHYLRSHARNANTLLENLYTPFRRGGSR
jgi:tetratricopeptide (TPR) repeat protein